MPSQNDGRQELGLAGAWDSKTRPGRRQTDVWDELHDLFAPTHDYSGPGRSGLLVLGDLSS